jgi:hypothetical protein
MVTAMPDRLPSLVLLVGFWIPPAVVGRAAADLVHRSTTRIRPAVIFGLLTTFVLMWSTFRNRARRLRHTPDERALA